MALLKTEDYKGFTIDLGEVVEDVQAEQLSVTSAELAKAINQENLTDRLFGRILTNRSKSHQALMDAVPGAKSSE
jgi:hypothetical protein